ncbi:MAG: methionine--tRNA ligase [Candidatus Methanoplasma sp.]|jgi:methionyl-tRNA synthetase|nr:methionine--tRNA ligase [Candidatus Methanoplasma sp.]
MSKICINIAWPYANGPIHLGHAAGSLLPPDIFGRYNRLKGNEVLVVGGSDQHGTPITVTAEKEKSTPAVIAEKFHNINKKAIEDMDIEYSLFSKTHGANHIEVVQRIFTDLLNKGYLYEKEMNQYYCTKCQKFLPDRYVEGTCPNCGAKDVRSDQCDACGTTFEPGDLIDARCIHCGTKPEVRPSNHFFLKLSAFNKELMEFLDDKSYWRSNVNAYTKNWLKEGLIDRAITRDMSWGVPVPVPGWEDKVIYVWFEALIGYLSTSIEYSKMIGDPEYWKGFWKNPETKHYYFIGKDNIPFHSIIWPAILMGAGGLNLPYDIPANEYLMFNGGKLSKSRGGAIDIPSVLSEYDVDSVRYYLSINMPDTHDAEFTWEDFQTKINNELVSALGNYYHRCLSFAQKNFGTIPDADTAEGSKEVTDAIASALKEYDECLSKCDFKKGLKVVMELSRFGNRYFDSSKPWSLVKTDKEQCGRVINNNLRIVKALAVMAWPYMPSSSEKIWEYLGYDESLEKAGIGAAVSELPAGRALKEPVPVYKKVEIPEENEKDAEPTVENDGPFKDFRKLDLRVGKVMSAEDHPDAEKLFVLKVDIGETEPRQIVAGLRAYYSKEQMVGRKIFLVSNLKPAKLRGLMSQGMLLAADDEAMGGTNVLLLKPSKDVPVGTKMNSGVENTSSMIEYKDFQNVKMIVSRISEKKILSNSMEIELPENSPERVAAVIDGDKAIVLSDGNGCVATVDSEIKDGAGVR